MNGEQLHYFALAYSLRSFPAAAAQIPMSSQGLAKSIKALEQELDVPLFTLDANGSRVPTAYADAVMQFADAFQESRQGLQNALEQVRRQQHEMLRLGVSLGTAGFFAQDCIASFIEEHPQVTIEYDELGDALCDETLRNGAYDLAFTLTPFSSDFITTSICCEPMMLWVYEGHPLFNETEIHPEQLEGCVLAMPGKDIKCNRRILEAMASVGANPASVIISSEIFWLYQLASDRKGLGFTVEHIANMKAFCFDDAVRAIPLADMQWTIGLSYLPTHQLSHIGRLFWDHCAAFARARK